MIRRDMSLPEGRPGWLLVSQIEHARLSGELAADWGASPFRPIDERDELLSAILRHDDGWSEWERRPGVDPATGIPRDFTEMPLDESLVIWRTSIECAASLSPLAGYVVAGHFLALLSQSAAWTEHGTRTGAAAHQWAAEFRAEQGAWLQEWTAQSRHNAAQAAVLAERSLDWLRFFDRLSLWFCVADEREPTKLETPSGPAVELMPQGGSAIVLDPWPFFSPGMELSLSGKLLPQDRYADAAAMAAAWQPTVIRLLLVPA